MTISIWRYSHLTLAVLSFILLTVASVTGVVLAFKPIQEKLQPYRTAQVDQLTLAESLPRLKKSYPDISEISIDANKFVRLKGTDTTGEKIDAYIHPITGKVLGTPQAESEFFQWVTAFHRSLFAHETGRLLVGISAFLLSLITISGSILIIQRQLGIKRFFKRVLRDNFAQYYHVVLGRLSLVPILILALSGTYLSLERFQLIGKPIKPATINFDAIRETPVANLSDFAVFKQIKLNDVERIEFPFSTDVEDYYVIKLKTKELAVNQLTGDILSEVSYPSITQLTHLSLDLHTGRGNMAWAVILLIASANILFFIYSGFAITWKRLSGRTRNKYRSEDCKYIILVGSENGHTFAFAKAIHRALFKNGEKSYITELDKYTCFPKANHLIILTATYGIGEAPSNGKKFTALLARHPQAQQVNFSVLGFGSHAYPDFCKFAFEVHQLLAVQSWAVPLTDVHTVNDRSIEEFGRWAEAWSQHTDLPLQALSELKISQSAPRQIFTVVANSSAAESEGTFVINLKPKKKVKVTSGDLLAIYPQNDHRERLYSIGIVDHQLRLSVRLHTQGIGSSYLSRLRVGENLKARIIANPHFQLPEHAKEIVMISNGTGIAPFLGMINQNIAHKPIYLYCGFRNQLSYSQHQALLEESQREAKLSELHVAFSRENRKAYVSELINKDAGTIIDLLNADGVVMICGSLAMEKDVVELLNAACAHQKGKDVSYYRSRGQLLTDCY
jgi:sulfite reductase (NADPH) flavoprotein alpha-component